MKTPVINDRVLTGLNKAYQNRLKNDEQLHQFVTDTEEIRQSYMETKISLNEATRKKEMEDAQAKKATNNLNTSLGTEDSKKVKHVNLEDLDDEYLREGLFVLSDLITLKIG